jgi:hypothetical protein
MEALLHAAIRTDEVGYRLGSQKFVLLFTDATAHLAGAYAGAGPNDYDAFLENEDFPALRELGDLLEAQGVFPIFAATAGLVSYYQSVVDGWGFGAVTTLSSDSSNISDAVQAALRAASPDVTANILSDEFGMVKSITPDTLTRPVPGTYEFTITLDANEDLPSYGSDRILVDLPGFGQVTLDIAVPRTDRTGTSGPDSISGTNGPNGLFGAASNDSIDGRGGDDLINGGAGLDVLTGGLGNDSFVFNRGEADGDAITDFVGNGSEIGDRLVFSGYGAGATFTFVESNLWRVSTAESSFVETITLTNGPAVATADVLFV